MKLRKFALFYIALVASLIDHNRLYRFLRWVWLKMPMCVIATRD